MDVTTLKIINWKNLSFKNKCWFVLFMSFASLWIFVSILLTFKSSDLNQLQSLFLPFAMLAYLLNPDAFQNPQHFNKSHFPHISKIFFGIAICFLCTPFLRLFIN